MLGKTISHYTIKSQIGEGGMGVVYEAEDINLGRHVALKFLTPAMAGDENLLQRFQREARAASSLNHPNICTIHGIEQFESDHFIVMELLDGESLADRIRRGPLDLDSVLTLGVQIVDALESAHSRGIVHRDLKPANIFVTSRSQACGPHTCGPHIYRPIGAARLTASRGSRMAGRTARRRCRRTGWAGSRS